MYFTDIVGCEGLLCVAEIVDGYIHEREQKKGMSSELSH